MQTQWIFETKDKNLVVKKMEISFDKENDNSLSNVKEILIVQQDENQMYENNRTLILKVKNGLLEYYSIKGTEEFVLNEKQEFLVEATIKQE